MRREIPFYNDGLQFECVQCHACCRHDPGYVFLSQRDLNRLARGTDLDEASFKEKYTRVVDFGFVKRLSLTEKKNYDCIFWKEGIGCSVYEHRPLQCRAFPFWEANLVDKETWDATGQSCPGVNRGKLHRKEDIESWLRTRSAEPLLES